jgi:hypothetical protein
MKPIEHKVQGPGGLLKSFTAIPIMTVAEIQEQAAAGVNVTDPAVIQAQIDSALASAGVGQIDAARQAAKSTTAREAPEVESPDPE